MRTSRRETTSGATEKHARQASARIGREPRGLGQRPGGEPDVRSAPLALPVSVGRQGPLEILTRPTEGALFSRPAAADVKGVMTAFAPTAMRAPPVSPGNPHKILKLIHTSGLKPIDRFRADQNFPEDMPSNGRFGFVFNDDGTSVTVEYRVFLVDGLYLSVGTVFVPPPKFK